MGGVSDVVSGFKHVCCQAAGWLGFLKDPCENGLVLVFAVDAELLPLFVPRAFLSPGVLEDRLQCGPRQVEAAPAVARFDLWLKPSDDAKALSIALEHPPGTSVHHRSERLLSVMAEGRMAKIVSQGRRLQKIRELMRVFDDSLEVRLFRALGDSPADLRAFDRVR